MGIPLTQLADAVQKSSKTEQLGYGLLDQVLAENKGLQNVYKPGSVALSFASPTRLKQLNAAGMSDNHLEYWAPGEQGSSDFPRPEGYGGRHILEFYRNENAATTKQAMYGDLLHGMVSDPYFAALRREFTDNYTKSTQQFNTKLQTQGVDERSMHDMYIRGWLSPDERDEFRKAQAQTGNVYSDTQLDVLKRMQDYVKTGEMR